MLEAVRVDAVYGTSLGVRSTPTVFVDGVMLPSVEALQWALEAEAERLGLPAASR
jgi:protein-disulfide isomerase